MTLIKYKSYSQNTLRIKSYKVLVLLVYFQGGKRVGWRYLVVGGNRQVEVVKSILYTEQISVSIRKHGIWFIQNVTSKIMKIEQFKTTLTQTNKQNT